MDHEEGISLALIVSKRLRRLLLRVAGLTALAGTVFLIIDFLLPRSFWTSGHHDLRNLIMTTLPLLMIIGSLCMLVYWAVAAVLAKIYGTAAEDARDAAARLLNNREDK